MEEAERKDEMKGMVGMMGAIEDPDHMAWKNEICISNWTNAERNGKRDWIPHRPLDRDGRALCYNSSAHSGCVKGICSFSHQSRIKHEGLRWAAAYELGRRGGLTTPKRIEPQSVEGYLQALSEKKTMEIRRAIEESRNANGRSSAKKTRWLREDEWAPTKDSQDGEEEVANGPLVKSPMGLSFDLEEQREGPFHDDQDQLAPKCEGLCIAPDAHEPAEMAGPIFLSPHDYCDLAENATPCVQPVPRDFLRIDCSEMGNPTRGLLYESDKWMH